MRPAAPGLAGGDAPGGPHDGMPAATVAQALAWARAQGLARLDAQLLLAHAAGRNRSWVLANDQHMLDAAQQQRWAALAGRRAAGEPLAYLTGEREFHGLSLQVTPQVLVPRPDTELLVDWAIECIDSAAPAAGGAALRVLDLGTGSGAIALAIKQARPGCALTAVDISAEALAVARANGQRLGLPVHWLCSDWFAALDGERFDLILSNPPYIAEHDPHLPALRHEPRGALVSGPRGLDAIEHLAAAARAHLAPHGWLLLEHGHEQAVAVRALLQSRGYQDVATRDDLAGHPRCTAGRASDH